MFGWFQLCRESARGHAKRWHGSCSPSYVPGRACERQRAPRNAGLRTRLLARFLPQPHAKETTRVRQELRIYFPNDFAGGAADSTHPFGTVFAAGKRMVTYRHSEPCDLNELHNGICLASISRNATLAPGALRKHSNQTGIKVAIQLGTDDGDERTGRNRAGILA